MSKLIKCYFTKEELEAIYKELHPWGNWDICDRILKYIEIAESEEELEKMIAKVREEEGVACVDNNT